MRTLSQEAKKLAALADLFYKTATNPEDEDDDEAESFFSQFAPKTPESTTPKQDFSKDWSMPDEDDESEEDEDDEDYESPVAKTPSAKSSQTLQVKSPKEMERLPVYTGVENSLIELNKILIGTTPEITLALSRYREVLDLFKTVLSRGKGFEAGAAELSQLIDNIIDDLGNIGDIDDLGDFSNFSETKIKNLPGINLSEATKTVTFNRISDVRLGEYLRDTLGSLPEFVENLSEADQIDDTKTNDKTAIFKAARSSDKYQELMGLVATMEAAAKQKEYSESERLDFAAAIQDLLTNSKKYIAAKINSAVASYTATKIDQDAEHIERGSNNDIYLQKLSKLNDKQDAVSFPDGSDDDETLGSFAFNILIELAEELRDLADEDDSPQIENESEARSTLINTVDMVHEFESEEALANEAESNKFFTQVSSNKNIIQGDVGLDTTSFDPENIKQEGGNSNIGGNFFTSIEQRNEITKKLIAGAEKIAARDPSDMKLQERVGNYVNALNERLKLSDIQRAKQMDVKNKIDAAFPNRVKYDKNYLKLMQAAAKSSDKAKYGALESEIARLDKAISSSHRPRPEDIDSLAKLKSSLKAKKEQFTGLSQLFEKYTKEQKAINDFRKRYVKSEKFRENEQYAKLTDNERKVFLARVLVRDYLALKRPELVIDQHQEESRAYGDDEDELVLVNKIYDESLPTAQRERARAKFVLEQMIKRTKYNSYSVHHRKQEGLIATIDRLINGAKGVPSKTNKDQLNFIGKSDLLKLLEKVNIGVSTPPVLVKQVFNNSKITEGLHSLYTRYDKWKNDANSNWLLICYEYTKINYHPVHDGLAKYQDLLREYRQCTSLDRGAKETIRSETVALNQDRSMLASVELDPNKKSMQTHFADKIKTHESQIATARANSEGAINRRKAIGKELTKLRGALNKEIDRVAIDPEHFFYTGLKTIFEPGRDAIGGARADAKADILDENTVQEYEGKMLDVLQRISRLNLHKDRFFILEDCLRKAIAVMHGEVFGKSKNESEEEDE
jgi:hypothetical protein